MLKYGDLFMTDNRERIDKDKKEDEEKKNRR